MQILTLFRTPAYIVLPAISLPVPMYANYGFNF